MKKRAGLYIHIPFCARKCTYCNFNTTDFAGDLAGRYVGALIEEVTRLGRRLGAGGRACVDTLYFGGGTPSIVEGGQIAAIIKACRAAFDVAAGAEVTIEINPSTLERRKLDRWREAGVNRASVGVQSFNDSELVALSRTHAASDARRTFDALRAAGFDNVSLDLIAGLPAQRLGDWERNLRKALALRPEHLSLYLLEVKEGTQLFSQIKRGLRPRPDDDLAAEMFHMICDMAASEGYDHYEISNFALGGLRSKHNMKYWTGAAFYGVGCGAHSYDGRARWVNVLKTETYIDKVGGGESPVAELNELGEADRAAEALFMGLRLREGIGLKEFRAEYGLDVLSRYGSDLERLAEAGLVEIEDDRLRLTRAGMLLSNEVFVSFV